MPLGFARIYVPRIRIYERKEKKDFHHDFHKHVNVHVLHREVDFTAYRFYLILG